MKEKNTLESEVEKNIVRNRVEEDLSFQSDSKIKQLYQKQLHCNKMVSTYHSVKYEYIVKFMEKLYDVCAEKIKESISDFDFDIKIMFVAWEDRYEDESWKEPRIEVDHSWQNIEDGAKRESMIRERIEPIFNEIVGYDIRNKIYFTEPLDEKDMVVGKIEHKV